jgi:hypothetical protein
MSGTEDRPVAVSQSWCERAESSSGADYPKLAWRIEPVIGKIQIFISATRRQSIDAHKPVEATAIKEAQRSSKQHGNRLLSLRWSP